MANEEIRTFEEWRDTGLLWLINRTVFHPRGFALALVYADGVAVGWSLLGDGSEAWMYGDEQAETEKFRAVEATFAQLRGGA